MAFLKVGIWNPPGGIGVHWPVCKQILLDKEENDG